MGHQPTRRTVRSAASVAMAAAALLGAGLPAATQAHAADPGRYLFVDAPDSVTVLPRTPAAGPGDTFKSLQVTVSSEDDAALQGTRLTVDARGLAGKAELQLPAGCTFTGTTRLLASCTSGHAAAEQQFLLGIRAAQGATAGTAGTIRYTATADGAAQDAADETVTAVKVASGPDLAVPVLAKTTRLAPGGTVTVPTEVGNVGDQDAKGLILIASVPGGFRLAGSHRNCRYGVTEPGTFDLGNTVLCRFDTTTLPVGATYRLSEPLTVTAAKDAGTGFLAYAFDVAGGEIDGLHLTGGTPGTGPELTLAPAPGAGARTSVKDIDSSNNVAVTTLDTGQRTDLAVRKVSVSGTVGRPLPLTLTVRNQGNAAVQPLPVASLGLPGATPPTASAMVMVELPAGVTVQRAPRYCTASPDGPVAAQPGALLRRLDAAQRPTAQLLGRLRTELARGRTAAAPYLCWVEGGLPVGGSASLTFTLKPTKALHQAVGSYEAMPFAEESKESNDQAAILISAAAATGGTGSAGGTGSTGTTGTAGSAGSTGGATTGGNTPGPQSSGGSAATGGTGGGSLASTGSSGTGLLAGVGAAALVAGAGVVLVARRRRA